MLAAQSSSHGLLSSAACWHLACLHTTLLLGFGVLIAHIVGTARWSRGAYSSRLFHYFTTWAYYWSSCHVSLFIFYSERLLMDNSKSFIIWAMLANLYSQLIHPVFPYSLPILCPVIIKVSLSKAILWEFQGRYEHSSAVVAKLFALFEAFLLLYNAGCSLWA